MGGKSLFVAVVVVLIAAVSWSAQAQTKSFVCSADDVWTSAYYKGKLFSLNIDSTYIKLTSLTDKKYSFYWKIDITDSSGDVQGSRYCCIPDKMSRVHISFPAIFRMSEMKFTVLTEDLQNPRFSCEKSD